MKKFLVILALNGILLPIAYFGITHGSSTGLVIGDKCPITRRFHSLGLSSGRKLASGALDK